MKKIIILAVVSLFGVIISYNAQAGSGLGFFIGLSTPNDQINDVYNSDKLAEISTGNLYREATSSGFDIGAKLRLPVNDNLTIFGSIGWNRYPQSKIEVKDPSNTDGPPIATLLTTQNIVPIGFGVNFYPFQSHLSVYGTGELTYNYLYNSVELDVGSDFNLTNKSPSYNRIGAGFGAGIDLDLEIILLNLEAKYNFANLIGKSEDEKSKNYLTLNVGVFFGGSNSDSNSPD